MCVIDFDLFLNHGKYGLNNLIKPLYKLSLELEIFMSIFIKKGNSKNT